MKESHEKKRTYLKIWRDIFITKEFEQWLNIREPILPFYGISIFDNLQHTINIPSLLYLLTGAEKHM